MKTNKLLVASAAATMMMTGLTTNAYAVGATGTSKATVHFDLPKDAVPVKDPTAPEKDMERSTDGGTVDNATSAGLSLDYVTNLNFGENKSIEGKDQTFETTTTEPFIQVSDRRGTGDGWNVTAKVDHFKQGETETLDGAKIVLTQGVAKDAVGHPVEPDVNPDIELMAGGDAAPVVIAKAKTDDKLASAAGLGTWIISWLKSNNAASKAELVVPANAASEGTHNADITWTLTSGV
ncbi:WxL domain-containing protein [Macrococcus bovicus]|uniref:WxL domain-containing protein n=1 Tax=Macrococcus bovicus TaxID=69968 RepID=UPI0025A59852|nr:WxL domain-containing protein [Macrococcus bovicus]WJP98495.1 WxL domain-containing protein [Macrococcus bovicus]